MDGGRRGGGGGGGGVTASEEINRKAVSHSDAFLRMELP